MASSERTQLKKTISQMSVELEESRRTCATLLQESEEMKQGIEAEKMRAEEWRKEYEMSVEEFDRLLDAEEEKQRDTEQQLGVLLATTVSRDRYQKLLTEAESSETQILRLRRALRMAEKKLRMRCELSLW
jgi:chromosome segregation ATPase